MQQPASAFDASKFKVKAILIDLDGTLINTAPEIARAANTMLSALNLPNLAALKIQSFIGDGAPMLISRCLAEANKNALTKPVFVEKMLNQALALFSEHYANLVTLSEFYPKALASLKALKETGLPLACVTNKPAKFTEPLLRAKDLFDYFELVVSGDTLAKKKPEPDQIFHCCKKFNIEPWDALLIGDSNTDILAAKNAGCYIFTVPYGYNQGQTIDANTVDIMLEDLSETLSFIQI